MKVTHSKEGDMHRVVDRIVEREMSVSIRRDRRSCLSLCALVVAVCFAAVSCSINAAEATDESSQSAFILALDAEYFARLAADSTSIADLLHEDFRYLTHYQTELSKHRLLEYLRQSPKLVERFKLGDRYVYSAGDQRLIWGTVRTQGQSDEFESVTSRYWHVWQRAGSQWLLLRRQAGLLDQDAD